MRHPLFQLADAASQGLGALDVASRCFFPDVTNTFYFGDAFIGYGAQFLVGQGDSPTTYVAAPDIERIAFGDMTTGTVPKTHLRSPARHEELLATIRRSGVITLGGNYRPEHGAHKRAGGDGFSATHNLLMLWINVTENEFKIVMPDTVNSIALPLRGVITKYQIGELTLEGKTMFTAEITPLSDYSSSLP